MTERGWWLVHGVQGVNKPWEQHQMSTFRSPNSIYETKSRMSDTSSGVYPSNASRPGAQPAPYRRGESHGRPARSEDGDSVFDDGGGCFCTFFCLFLFF